MKHRGHEIAISALARETADVVVRHLKDQDGTAAAALQTVNTPALLAEVMMSLAIELLDHLTPAGPVEAVLGADWAGIGVTAPIPDGGALGDAVVSYTWWADPQAVVAAVEQCSDDLTRLLATVVFMADAVLCVRSR